MRIYNVLILLVMLSLLSACSTTGYTDDPAAQYKNYSAQQLYVAGKQSLASKNYNKAVKYFEALESLYPFGDYAEKGQLDLVYAYYKSGDYASATAAADQYIHVYPRSKHVDYAYYMKGLSDLYAGETWIQRALPINMSLRDLTSPKQAFYDFRDLVQLFPNSKYAPDARQHMIYLRNLFAEHELEIADYYYQRQAYVAAANRASYLIQHYQHAPQVEDALVILVKANRALNLAGPANDALAVLRTNFPNSKALYQLQRGQS